MCVVTNTAGSTSSTAATMTVTASLPSTNYVTSTTLGALRNNFSGWVGMSITVGGSPVNVAGLGRMFVAGNTGSHTVKIVSSNGQDVSGGSVSVSMAGGTAGNFVYANLPASVTLNANTTYYIVSQEAAGGDQWYDINSTIQTTTVAAETTGVWSPDGATYSLSGSANHAYVPVDFLYTVGVTQPVITQQPQSQTASVGGAATFSVTATGGSLSYQWKSEAPGASSFAPITGATGSSYTTSGVTMTQSGTQFMCVVTNTAGSTSSTAATMTVTASLPSTNYVTSTTLGALRNNFSGWLGMAVTIGNTPVSVTQLGRMVAPGNTGVHALKIVTSAGKDIVGSLTSVNTSGAASGAFTYSKLNSPVTLEANTTYYIISQETTGGDQWYDLNSIQTSTVAAEITGVWSTDGATYNVYGSGDQAYVPVDFQYSGPSASFVSAITFRGVLRNDVSGWFGMAVTTGASSLKVTQLGRYFAFGNSGTQAHTVKIVNASTGIDVSGGSVSVNLADGQQGNFVYESLSAQVTLSANTTYYIVSQETAAGDQWYDSSSTVQTSNAVTDTAAVSSPDGATYTQTGGTNQTYVPVSFVYSTQ